MLTILGEGRPRSAGVGRLLAKALRVPEAAPPACGRNVNRWNMLGRSQGRQEELAGRATLRPVVVSPKYRMGAGTATLA